CSRSHNEHAFADVICKQAPGSRRKDASDMQQGHEHADLKGSEGKGFEVKSPIRSKGANKGKMEEIEAGKTPVRKGVHPADSSRLSDCHPGQMQRIREPGACSVWKKVQL